MGVFLPYFEEEAYDKLLNSVETNKDNYNREDNKWIENFFGTEKYVSNSTLEVGNITLWNSEKNLRTEEENERDLANVIMLYSDYKSVITPQVASNKYLWTALAHTLFYSYTRSRWSGKDIKERFFCGSSRQQLVYYNSISRLWWAGYLTYSDEDQFSLTEVLLKSGQQTYKDLTDCAYSTNRKITRGIIKAIKMIKEDPDLINFGDCFRDLNKYLNRTGAVTCLDFLDEESVCRIAFDYMSNWQNTHRK